MYMYILTYLLWHRLLFINPAEEFAWSVSNPSRVYRTISRRARQPTLWFLRPQNISICFTTEFRSASVQCRIRRRRRNKRVPWLRSPGLWISCEFWIPAAARQAFLCLPPHRICFTIKNLRKQSQKSAELTGNLQPRTWCRRVTAGHNLE